MASTACRLATRMSASSGRAVLKRPPSAARSGAANSVRALQRTVGNAATARLVQRSGAVRAREGATVRTSFDDCPRNAKDVIRERTQMAKAWVDYSIGQLDSILANPAKVDPDLHALLRKHFHVGAGARVNRAFQDVTTIRARFAQISSAFSRVIPFECESSCKANWRGYVTDYWIFGHGDIHVCPAFFTDGYQDQVATVIHEMTHRYLGWDDHAYAGGAAYAALSTEAAMKNPDSYAEFAKEI